MSFSQWYTILNLFNFEVLPVVFTFEMSKKTVDKGEKIKYGSLIMKFNILETGLFLWYIMFKNKM